VLSKEGFNFEFDETACQTCGAKCCRGSSGVVYFSKSELREMANFLQISEKEFLLDFTIKDGYKWSLKELKIDGEFHCVFLQNNICSIYSVRPLQCREFPFWNRFKSNINELKLECFGVLETEAL
jgi:Fe-S-cluster containining protein